MKGIKVLSVALIASVAVVACQGAAPRTTSPINPPSWIIGNWKNSTGVVAWTFTTNNVTYHDSSQRIGFDFAELNKRDGYSFQDDSKTATSYVARLKETTGDGTVVESKFSFTSMGTNTLAYSVTRQGLVAGPMTLHRQ